jgi:hypothetical protein
LLLLCACVLSSFSLFQFCVSVFNCWLSLRHVASCVIEVCICFQLCCGFQFLYLVCFMFSFSQFSLCAFSFWWFSVQMSSVFSCYMCVCVPHGCGIYVYDVIRDQYMFMCEHVSCCVHVCVQWVVVCCGCICFWCMWCHVCGHA